MFEHVQPPDEALFYCRGDSNDKRLGERVFTGAAGYKKADVVLLGVPQDLGVKRNKGREGAAKAPDEIRRAFYRLACPRELERITVADLGNLDHSGSLEDIHRRQENVVSQMLSDGKVPVVLGGGHDIAYPDGLAFTRSPGNRAVINIDAHLDLRNDSTPNSGTPFRQLIEEGALAPSALYEFGIQPQSNSSAYMDYAIKKGISVITLDNARRKQTSRSFAKILRRIKAEALFVSFDMDAVRASDSPGVSAVTPTGLSAEEITEIAMIAGRDARARIIDIAEVNPNYDLDGRTARLAALVIWYFVLGLASKNARYGTKR